MEVNDTPENDKTRFQLTGPGSTQEVFIEDDGEDVHVCRKCNVIFYDIHKYLEHKIKHDHYKVKYCRSGTDRRMILPTLVEKPITRKRAAADRKQSNDNQEKENEGKMERGKRGRKKKSEVDSELVITERPVYRCDKCDKKFSREAALRRHKDYDHNVEEEDEAIEVEDAEDDQDEDYQPKIDIKESLEEAQEVGDQEEMANLDQVIITAAIMERNGDQVTMETLIQQVESESSPPPAKQQKLSEEEKALRKYACNQCGMRFKELPVLKTHQLTHTNHRDFQCQYDGCTYSFKTKGSLKRHMRRHTGERPYPCELCGRVFAESGALTRHLKARVLCTSKSDNDLPRYGKKWTYEPSIPAAGKSEGQASTIKVNKALQTRTGQLNKDTMLQQVPEIPVSMEPEDVTTHTETLTNVVRELDDTLPQHKQLFDLDDAEGVEIVISEDHSVQEDLSDDNLPNLVHPETTGQLEVPFSSTHVCKVCQEECVSVDALKIHLRSHLAATDCRCWMCHYIANTKEEFENHLLLWHQLQLKNIDPFPQLLSLSEGVKKEVESGKEKTDVNRDAQVAVKQLLLLSQDQQDTNTDKKPGGKTLYECAVCSRRFHGSNYLKLHMRNHAGLRPHKCSECSKGFITKDTLNKHMLSHADDRNFKCGECGKLFKRMSHVREHLKIHSGSRPFPCTVCDKSFKTNNAMKVHLRTHTDILPYECTYCHRRFREKGSVIRHMRMHTGEKPYECQYCGRNFAEHGTLNRHLKAKVSCNRKDAQQHSEDYTVLAEFSSVVADTQQYIVEDTEEQIEETVVQEESQQAAEYVVLQTGMECGEVQNVEIITEDGEQASIGSIQVTDEYVVITDPEESGMKIIHKTTGEVVAMVPGHSITNDSQIQSITMSQEGEVSMVTLMSEGNPSQAQLDMMEDGTIVQGTILQHDKGVRSPEVETVVLQNDSRVETIKSTGTSVTDDSATSSSTLVTPELSGVTSDEVKVEEIQYNIESTQDGIQQVLEAAQELDSGSGLQIVSATSM